MSHLKMFEKTVQVHYAATTFKRIRSLHTVITDRPLKNFCREKKIGTFELITVQMVLQVLGDTAQTWSRRLLPIIYSGFLTNSSQNVTCEFQTHIFAKT